MEKDVYGPGKDNYGRDPEPWIKNDMKAEVKPIHVKPAMYALFFYDLKEIAKQYGYNLVLHGSMNRDLDLIAIPWSDDMKSEQDMIMEFQVYMTGRTVVMPEGGVHYTILPANRHSYVIEFNRGNRKGEWFRYDDEQYYLDISVIPVAAKQTNP